MDPQIAITVVAILGALAHFLVAVLRGLQDYRRAGMPSRWSDSASTAVDNVHEKDLP